MAKNNQISSYIKKNDPTDIQIMMNEFLFNLKKQKFKWCCLLISWIANFDKLLLKKASYVCFSI